MRPEIAVVGLACRYGDARSPDELWQNVLARRQAFRRIPPERLRLADYRGERPDDADSTYATEAALIEGFELDRAKFRVARSAHRSADLAHWLALDVAALALNDAGLDDAGGWPRERTGVLVGNTLTGEFSRADAMRLRWPYVRRVTAAALADEGFDPDRTAALLERLERAYKRPFHPMDEDSLAGGLSNTIAGRIASHFGLRGGGYTVDGACASSLLAAIHACSALAAGDLDAALAGGVDLSLDPFELVGFARTGALARGEMRVYDARSAGFVAGEGCGFAVLMRRDDALTMGLRIRAVIRGWGVSSDAGGGLTHPEVEGQLLALRRAYRKAGCGIGSVAYFEGHGTGTALGDATELRALATALGEAAAGDRSSGERPAVGSIKANVGHTKAAAGVAGLIKTVLAVERGILPPNTACDEPHPELVGDAAALRIVRRAEAWPRHRPRRAGVSAMGFGGVNAHLVLEGDAGARPGELGPLERRLDASTQDAELVVAAGRDARNLLRQVERLLAVAPGVARAELADLAAAAAGDLPAGRPLKAAVVASTPAELAAGLESLRADLAGGTVERFDVRSGVFLSNGAAPRIGYLFSGQGSPARSGGGLWLRRFNAVEELYRSASLPAGDAAATEVAQPAVAAASLAGLRVLAALGIEAGVAVGHSLGELSALYWAGAWDEPALLRVVKGRGRTMAEVDGPAGAMASIEAAPDEVDDLVRGTGAVQACFNAPRRTVVSGPADAVVEVVARARRRGLAASDVPVSRAFHSPLVAPAAPRLAALLEAEPAGRLERTVVSTVTGAPLGPDDDLRALLVRQVSSPVRFTEALSAAADRSDLWFEVGPGRLLGDLATAAGLRAISLDAGGPSLAGLLRAAGAAFVFGAPVRLRALFDDRFTRPFDLDRRPKFFVNPCELAPAPEAPAAAAEPRPPERQQPERRQRRRPVPDEAAALRVVRQLAAERLELPTAAVEARHGLLADLHLSSIAASQLVAEAAGRLGVEPPPGASALATATVGDLAKALEALREAGGERQAVEGPPAGVDAWVRTFTFELIERPLPRRARPADDASTWRILGPTDHPLRAALSEVLGPAQPGSRADGVVLCLPPDPGEEHVELLLDAARAVETVRPRCFVAVQHGGGGGAFARTLHLETGITTRVVDVPPVSAEAAAWVAREARATQGFAEARYDVHGVRREVCLRLLAEPNDRPAPVLGEGDVLLVSGGGKGIAAECALAIAQTTGVRLALFGRSREGADPELDRNLDRFAAAGVTASYRSANVTDADAVRAAVAELTAELGPITTVLHAAGINRPRLLADLDAAAFRRTLAPKLSGLEHLLATVDPERLRLLVTFGSVIARTGLAGEADYAVANAWMRRRLERFAAEHPGCRCLNLEWSAWSGAGMAERLGRVEALEQGGVTPIAPEAGAAILVRLLSTPPGHASVVVSGRLGDAATLRFERPELPFLRFLERPRVVVPGVEVVADSELSVDADPYVEDHAFEGERLLPAVFGLEAMAQAAMAAAGTERPPAVFERVRFDRPIVVPREGSVTLRAAALVRESGRVDVVLRTSASGFGVDHFRARCRFDGAEAPDFPAADAWSAALAADGAGEQPIPLDPAIELYGGVLFQGGRFRRLRRYRRLCATGCLAEIDADAGAAWFGRYHPARLVLGDPGARDAALHAVQACVPQEVILPVAARRFVPGPARPVRLWRVAAYERHRDRELLTWDLGLVDEKGRPGDRWEGLELRVVGSRPAPPWWPPDPREAP